MHLAPDALLDDGLLEVIAIERVGKLRFLAHLPKVFRGTHVRLAYVRVFRAAEVEISRRRARSRCTPTATRSASCPCACVQFPAR